MNKKGFSLIELIASLTIIAMISSIAMLSYSSYRKDTRKKEQDILRETIISQFNNKRINDSSITSISIASLDLNSKVSFSNKKCVSTSGSILVKRKKDISPSYLNSLFQDEKYSSFPISSLSDYILNNNQEVYCITFYCNDTLVIDDSNTFSKETIKVDNTNYVIDEINYCK